MGSIDETNCGGSVALTFAAVFTGMSQDPQTDVTTPRYKRHRFPAEIMAHAVWLERINARHSARRLANSGSFANSSLNVVE